MNFSSSNTATTDIHNIFDESIVRSTAIGRRKETYFCEICSFDFLDQRNFELHLENHRKFYKCIKCSRFLESPARLITHSIRKHDQIASPNCKYCGKTFKYFNSLERHLYASHSDSVRDSSLPIDVDIRPEMFQCHLCKKTFFVKANLEKHLFTHSTTKPPRFLTNINRLDGVRINPDISEWDEGILIKNIDKLLGEQFTVNSIGERIGVYYACKLCEFKHKEITAATSHICQNHLRHLYKIEKNKILDRLSQNWNVSFNNPIGCPFCKKTFYQKFGYAGLHQHILRIHKELTCNHCSLSFGTRDEIYFFAHYLEHYRAGSKNDGALSLIGKLYKFFEEKTIFDKIQHSYSCLICGPRSKRFVDLDETYQHIRTHICNVYEFSIQIVGPSTDRTLKRQSVRSTVRRDFKCSKCLKRFKTQVGVKEHKRNVHYIIFVNVRGKIPSIVTIDSDRKNMERLKLKSKFLQCPQ